MTYKSINTFIDDLFAFVIKMPIMHRLACLRDDVIFFIFCYQRYKYKTDYTRINEFGQCQEPTEEMLKEITREDAAAAAAGGGGGGGGDEDKNEQPKEEEVAGVSDPLEQNVFEPLQEESTVRRRRGAKDRR